MRSIYAVFAVSLLALGCGKLGVGGSHSSGGSTSSSTVVAQPADPTPKIVITTPARGSFMATGRAAVEGHVIAVGTATADTVVAATVNGLPVALDASGTFRTFADLTSGLNMIEAVCTDQKGRNGSTVIGVLGGTYRPAGLPVPHAAVARVNDSSFDGISKIVEAALWATDWTALFQGLNPILDKSFLWMSVEANINQVRFRDVHVSLDSKTTGLTVDARLDAPILDCSVGADLGLGLTVGPYPAIASADSAEVLGTLGAHSDQQGVVTTSMGGHTITFNNFDLQVQNGLLDAAVQLFAKNMIADALRGFIEDALDNDLCPVLDQYLAQYLQQQTPFDILGRKYALDVRGEQVAFDDHGLTLSLGFNAIGNNGVPFGPAATAPGSLITAGAPPSTTTARGFLVSVDDDGANRALYGLWAAGVMDVMLDDAFLTQQGITSFPIKLEAGSLRRFLPEIGGVVPDASPVRVHVHAGLPPVVKVIGTPDIALAQAGELVLDVDVDRGNGFERLLTAVAQVEIGANVGLNSNGLQISSLSAPRFRFDLVQEPLVELDDRRLEVLLSVVMTPLVPHFMNATHPIFIPHLAQLQTVNVDVHADGPNAEHLSVSGDLLR